MYLHEVFDLEKLKSALPELPWTKRARYEKEFGIKKDDIDIFVTDTELADFYEGVLSNGADPKISSNYILSDLNGARKAFGDEFQFPNTKAFASIIRMLSENKISSRGAKDLVAILVKEDIDPESYAKEHGLIQEFDEGKLKAIAEAVISANPKVVEDYKGGNEKSIQFLVGQFMKESKGSANPQLALKVLQDLLK